MAKRLAVLLVESVASAEARAVALSHVWRDVGHPRIGEDDVVIGSDGNGCAVAEDVELDFLGGPTGHGNGAGRTGGGVRMPTGGGLDGPSDDGDRLVLRRGREFVDEGNLETLGVPAAVVLRLIRCERGSPVEDERPPVPMGVTVLVLLAAGLRRRADAHGCGIGPHAASVVRGVSPSKVARMTIEKSSMPTCAWTSGKCVRR